MKVNIHSTNFNADVELINFIQKRMDKLELFYDKIIDADVYLRLENTSEKENKFVETKVHIPGEILIVKKKHRSFEGGVDMSCSSVERKLKKYKEKLKSR